MLPFSAINLENENLHYPEPLAGTVQACCLNTETLTWTYGIGWEQRKGLLLPQMKRNDVIEQMATEQLLRKSRDLLGGQR